MQKDLALPILDEKREREKLSAVEKRSLPSLREYDRALFSRLMALSRMHQEELLETEERFLGQEDEP